MCEDLGGSELLSYLKAGKLTCTVKWMLAEDLNSWVRDKGLNYSIATVRASAFVLVSQAPISTG